MVIFLIIWGIIGLLLLGFLFFIDKGTNAISQNSTFLNWLFKKENWPKTVKDIILYIIICFIFGPIGWILAVDWVIVSIINKFLYK
jgi:hypothetical protein